MAKLDELTRQLAGNVQESVSATASAGPARGLPGRLERHNNQHQGVSRAVDVLNIEIGRIIPDPDQPRREFDDESLNRMSASLLKQGQIMPIAVRWSEPSDRYVIVAGERRWRAAMRAGITSLKAVVRDGSEPPIERLTLQLVENMHREDLSPLDLARAYRRIMEENGWNGSRLAAELEIDHSRIVHALALLDLPESIRERVALEEITATGAYELAKIADPIKQEELAARVVEGHWTRDQIRDQVKKVTARGGARNPGKGRGGKKSAKRPKLPTTWKLRDRDSGFTLVVERRKGFEPVELVEFLRTALARAERECPGSAEAEVA